MKPRGGPRIARGTSGSLGRGARPSGGIVAGATAGMVPYARRWLILRSSRDSWICPSACQTRPHVRLTEQGALVDPLQDAGQHDDADAESGQPAQPDDPTGAASPTQPEADLKH